MPEVEPARVLVIEDEALIRVLLSDMLDELGHTMVGPFETLSTAEEAALEQEFDVAILDVNLNGKPTSSVAAILKDRQLPFVVATGYTTDLPAEFAGAPMIAKPFRLDDLERELLQLLSH